MKQYLSGPMPLYPIVFTHSEIPHRFYFSCFERWHFCHLIPVKSLIVEKVRTIKLVLLVPRDSKNYFIELLESTFLGSLSVKEAFSNWNVTYIWFRFSYVIYLKCKIPGFLRFLLKSLSLDCRQLPSHCDLAWPFLCACTSLVCLLVTKFPLLIRTQVKLY